MLEQRILTVAVLLPLFLAALFMLPNLYWGVLTSAGLALAAAEWGRLAGLSATAARVYAVVLAAAALAVLVLERNDAFGPGFLYSPWGRFLYALDLLFWVTIVPVWLYLRRSVRAPLTMAAVGALVLFPFWHALVWLQHTPGRLLSVLALVWVADTAAYFTGRAFGRRKLAPHISPGKTWEGAAGALAGVIVYWLLLAALSPRHAGPMPLGLLLPLLLLPVSIYGDLFESWLKRMAGQKDSGTLLPGHGGLLDRVDALTSTLPLAALYFAWPALRL
ncbi:MAG: phosphatidate cytidylyltransferase [Burkholderiales bacterium]|nr:phosphatidate cytidylyltransferase [Burkholderiales bacterium]